MHPYIPHLLQAITAARRTERPFFFQLYGKQLQIKLSHYMVIEQSPSG